ncbi:hypothetical protein D9M71_753100 [compost metagenome]
MQHGLMPDGDAFADRECISRVGMQHRPLLHITVLTDANRLVIPAQHGLGPDTDALFQGDIADNGGVLRDKGFGVDGRNQRVVLIDSHCCLLRLERRFSKRPPHTIGQCARRCNPTRA